MKAKAKCVRVRDPFLGVCSLSAKNNTKGRVSHSRVVGRGGNNANANYGLVYANASHASSSAVTFCGSRLAFKSEKLAAYAGRQFAEIYADFCFKPKSEETKG